MLGQHRSYSTEIPVDWSKILDVFKLSPLHFLGVAIASGTLLFGRKSWHEVLGTDAFLTNYRTWIGLVFLGSVTIVSLHALSGLWRSVARVLKRRELRSDGEKRLQNLTPEEKEILRYYIEYNTRTQNLNIQDGIVQGLEHEVIIYRSSNMGSMVDGFAYNIQPWAWEHLRKHPELLDDNSESHMPSASNELQHRRRRPRSRSR